MKKNDNTVSTKELADDFRSFEIDHSLFDLHIDGIPLWERIRFNIFRKIKRQNGIKKVTDQGGRNFSDYLKAGFLFTKNIAFRNPFTANEADIMFIGNSRRKKRNDGYWWDIYCDPINDYCTHDYVLFESPRPQSFQHLKPAKTEKIRYLELLLYTGTIQRKLGMKQISIPAMVRNSLVNVSDAIKDVFNAKIDLIKVVKNNLHKRATELSLYQRLIGRVDPNVLVLTQGYGKETVIEACQKQGVSVVELQHGVIHTDHFGYAYPGPRTKEMFPDYLFVWGEFWKNNVEYPIPDERVIDIGYPYFEQQRNQYIDMRPNEQILFISQDEIGDRLSKFACEVDQHPKIEHEVIFKLHPNEYNEWEENYPWLTNSNIEVIDSSEPPLYQLFSESRVQVGAYSTAIYEGLGFNLETYLYECPGVERLQSLVDDGTATLVSSADEIASSLGRSQTKFDREEFFTSDATQNICDMLDKIVSNQTP